MRSSIHPSIHLYLSFHRSISIIYLFFNQLSISIHALIKEYIINPEEEIMRAELLDSTLLNALIHCDDHHPSRHSVIITLLSSTNYCRLDACAAILVKEGYQHIEALLCLYRSHHQHSTVLSMLNEENCVTIGDHNHIYH